MVSFTTSSGKVTVDNWGYELQVPVTTGSTDATAMIASMAAKATTP
ncbi:hypothetical protein [Neorhizobium sp. DAR64872/K0K18]